MPQSALHFNLGLPWVTITSSQTLQPQVAYFVNGTADITLALPVTFHTNDQFYIYNNMTGFDVIISQNAGQYIIGPGGTSSTVGVTGALESTMDKTDMLLQCIDASLQSIKLNILDFTGTWGLF